MSLSSNPFAFFVKSPFYECALKKSKKNNIVINLAVEKFTCTAVQFFKNVEGNRSVIPGPLHGCDFCEGTVL